MDTAHDFTTRLHALLRREQGAMAEFLVALADFDSRRLWVGLGYASLFDFLQRELGLSKGAAFYRKTAADLIRRFPDVVDALKDGRLCLMTVAEVARVLEPENHDAVLPRFFHLSKREAKALAAELDPDQAPVRRDVITPIRAAAAPALAIVPPSACTPPATTAAVLPVEPVAAPELVPASTPSAATPTATSIRPMTSELNRLGVTVSRHFLEKLDAARAALSHSHPGATTEEILEAGLDLVLERDAKRKGLVKNPRREPPPSSDDHVPAHVSRAVWRRDEGRCQWPLASGGICGSTHRAQLDHVVPRALGGSSAEDNLRILCAFHNDLAAREAYGDDWMDRFTPRPRAREPVASYGAAPASPPEWSSCPCQAPVISSSPQTSTEIWSDEPDPWLTPARLE